MALYAFKLANSERQSLGLLWENDLEGNRRMVKDTLQFVLNQGYQISDMTKFAVGESSIDNISNFYDSPDILDILMDCNVISNPEHIYSKIFFFDQIKK